MNSKSILHTSLQFLVITGYSIFSLAPANAEDTARVTTINDVSAETDFQMRGYIKQELLDGTWIFPEPELAK